MIQKWVLNSGAHILFDIVDKTDSVCVGFWFNCGSRDEQNHVAGRDVEARPRQRPTTRGSERGFTHFLEHMLFKGTQQRSAFQIAKEIDRVGGYINAFTERESTCFYAMLPCEHLALAVDVLSDMIFSSVLDPEEINKEKSVIINEILSILDSPEELAHESYLSNLWGAHPLAWRITGSVEDINQIERDRLLDFYRKRFVTKNLVVSVAGRFDAAEVLSLIERAIDRCTDSRSNLDFLADRAVPKKESAWIHQKERFKQVQIYTGTDLPVERGDHGLLYDALVFSNAVGESMSSRLFQKIREEKALCYSISSYRTLFTDISLWTIYCNTAPEAVTKLLGALNDELRRLLADPLTEDEVEDAKNHLKGTLTLAKEDMEVRMKRLFRLHILVGEVIEYEKSFELIDTVNRERILRVTDQILTKRDFNLVALGSSKIKNFGGLRFRY